MVYAQALALTRRLLRRSLPGVLLLAACSTAGAGTGLPPDLAQDVASLEGTKAEIVADNIVTIDELEAAAYLVRDCVVGQGVTVERFSFDKGDIRIRMSVESSSDSTNPTAAVEEVYDECLKREFALLSDIYNFQNQLTASEREELDHEWLSCLQNRGLNVETMDEVNASNPDHTDAVIACAEDLEEAGW